MKWFYQIEENTNDYNYETHTYNSYELVKYQVSGNGFELLFVGSEQQCKDKLKEIGEK